MRFPTIFRRRVGEPPSGTSVKSLWYEQTLTKLDLILELGSDKLGGAPENLPRRDNLHESTMVNKNGFPSQRIAVGYLGPENAPSLLADAYIFDETSGSWFKIPPSGAILNPGELTYFDPPCLLDHSRAKKHELDESNQAGSLEVLLIVSRCSPIGTKNVWEDGAGGVLPDGIYAFVIGTDVSNPA